LLAEDLAALKARVAQAQVELFNTVQQLLLLQQHRT
jgi:hypothetical protein